MRSAEIGFVAGVVEGEGSIDIRGDGRYPRLQINMTDRDVLKTCQRITGLGHVRGPYETGHKPMYAWDVSRQADAAGLLMTLYPFLGARRQARIREVLTAWRTNTKESV